jgi:hypothetical protein
MRSEEQVIEELNALRGAEYLEEKYGDAICIVATYLDQIGKREMVEALRAVGDPEPRKRPALTLVPSS